MYDPISIAVGGASLIGGALGLWGSNTQANATTNAANTESNAQLQAAQMQQQQYQQTRQDLSPYTQSGTQALSKLSSTQPFNFTFNTSGANADPSYQWRLQQGLAGVNASAAAGGNYFSGATGQALENYGQGAASQEYQAQYNRALGTYQNNYNDLYNVASMGENAAAQTGQFGAQAAGNAGNAMVGAAQAQGQGMTGAANAYAGGLANVGNQINSGIGSLAQYQLMQKYMNPTLTIANV